MAQLYDASPTLALHRDGPPWPRAESLAAGSPTSLPSGGPVRGALYERARSSDVVAKFADDLNDTWRRMLSHALSDSVPDTERPIAVEALIATIQGVLLHEHSAAGRRRLIGFAVERLTHAD